jgi:predicted nuclease of restriction endonuclease-like (RecB) superfamily
MRGLSPRNMKYMPAFAEAWPESEWYIRKTTENGWSRSVLELQIETAAHRRVGAAQTNFDRALPSPQSDLARDILKDSYTFDFLGITDASNERTIEKALVLRLRDFLIELGVGSAFVGSQNRLEVDGRNGCARLVVSALLYFARIADLHPRQQPLRDVWRSRSSRFVPCRLADLGRRAGSIFGVWKIPPGAAVNPECAARRRYRRSTERPPGGQFQIK